MTYYKPIGAHTTISNLSTAQDVTLPAGADGVLCQAFTQNVRVRFDGSDATASAGFQIEAGLPVQFIPLALGASFSVIEETASASFQYQAVKIKG